MALTSQEIARRADVRARFIDSIAQSVNASDGRSAEYVANVLLVHQPRLLAEAAIVFAEAEVKLLLAEGEQVPEGVSHDRSRCVRGRGEV